MFANLINREKHQKKEIANEERFSCENIQHRNELRKKLNDHNCNRENYRDEKRERVN